MTDLFTTPTSQREHRRIADCLRHAAEWDTIAREQPNSLRGRALAADARATAERLRAEATQTLSDD